MKQQTEDRFGKCQTVFFYFGLTARERRKMRVTRHNGRATSNTAKHNDRAFDVSRSEHIDEEQAARNLYWDCYQGFRIGDDPVGGHSTGDALSFSEVEERYYIEHYEGYTAGQNARNEAARHSERNKTTDDLLHGKRTQPEETILQVGNIDGSITPKELGVLMQQYQEWFEDSFGRHVHILDWALHRDETTPHIHERHVFDYTNSYGELQPVQEKALEALGFERPDLSKPSGRNNNRKMSFDAACREKFIEIVRNRDHLVESEPVYGGRAYMEKQDFIIANQKQRIARQEEAIASKETELETLNVRIGDLEALINEVTDTAYEKAVDALSGIAAQEAVSEVGNAIRRLDGSLANDSRLSRPQKDLIHRAYAKVSSFIRNSIGSISDRIRKRLRIPEISLKVKDSVRKRVSTSSLAKLREAALKSKELAGSADSSPELTRGRSEMDR